jgi:hypothetical protein
MASSGGEPASFDSLSASYVTMSATSTSGPRLHRRAAANATHGEHRAPARISGATTSTASTKPRRSTALGGQAHRRQDTPRPARGVGAEVRRPGHKPRLRRLCRLAWLPVPQSRLLPTRTGTSRDQASPCGARRPAAQRWWRRGGRPMTYLRCVPFVPVLAILFAACGDPWKAWENQAWARGPRCLLC